jgi:DNA-binding transcriptional regulator YiaG
MTNLTKHEFAHLLSGWRKRSGHSRADAARILCCTERTITNWERERSMPRGFTLRAIVTFLEGGAR